MTDVPSIPNDMRAAVDMTENLEKRIEDNKLT